MIIIDGRESNLSISNFANLEEVLSRLIEEEDLNQRVVTDVLVDDTAFSELYPHQAEDIDSDSFERLELRTISLDEMAGNIIEELPKVVAIMDVGSRRVAELFRQVELSEGLEVLQDVIAVSRNLLQTIHVLRGQYSSAMNEELDTLGVSLGELLDEIGGGLGDEDWGLVADLLEYELVPACEGWRTVIRTLAGDITSARAA